MRLSSAWVKFAEFLMSILKQVNSSSNFASFFIVMTHKSSINYKLIHFLLWMKGSHQSPNFEFFQVLWWKFAIFLMSFFKLHSVFLQCSGQNSPYSCHFWNNKSVFLRILYQSSVSWDINPPYLFSWNFIYFQQKELIKVQIWWNVMWAVESLKFCTLMGSFCPNYIKFQLKSDAKFKEKLTCGFKYWHGEFGQF